MNKILKPVAVATLLASTALLFAGPEIKRETREENGKKINYMWIDGIKVHETDAAKQPQPKIVEPVKGVPGDKPAPAPAGAKVLFDGSKASLANWAKNGEPTKWVLVDGALESVKGGGYAETKEHFGSCQLHIEFATPAVAKGNGQGRGNSGVFLMGQYEIQVLDSYENTTYPDGQCGALYGRAKPLVNASRGPGQWQSYDITFHRPQFDADGKVTKKATFTVLHNGVLIHDKLVLSGGTGWDGPHSISPYRAHGDKGPIKLQDHGNPVRYRNIWIKGLAD
ncbi:MAG: hypothetical protein ACI97B_002871 [Verrucomicrobiales bacterium]|jgi:hypothetical protein